MKISSNNDFRRQGAQYREERYTGFQHQSSDTLQDEVNRLENEGQKSSPSKTVILSIIIGAILLVVIVLVLILVLKDTGSSVDTSSDRPPELYQEDFVEVVESRYPPDVVQSLRDAGYTGDEIEKMELNGDDPSQFIALSDLKHAEHLKEVYDHLQENITDEKLKKIVSNTWLVNPPVTFTQAVEREDMGEYVEPIAETITENVDYWKVPLHGSQAFLKIKLKSGEICFFQLPISRYETLRSSGNIVVNYNVVEFGGKKFIQNIVELESETKGLN